jgi:hypothetical protein
MTSAPDARPALLGRIERFLDDSRSENFDTLALEAFRLQCREIPAWRRFCAARGVDPERVTRWQDVPALPVFAFRSLPLHLGEPREIFRSSGTTGGAGERSVHYHPFPELYRQVIDLTFAPAVFGQGFGQAKGSPLATRRPLLSLVPSRHDVEDSSLGFWAEHILERHGDPHSVVAMTPEGVDTDAADAFCRRAAGAGEPVSILATALALLDWLERGHPAALPAGSTLVETGGFKGRRREISRPELLALACRQLGLEPQQVVREYGMSELTGHFYTEALADGDPDLFAVPHFLRVRALDPESLEEAPAGKPGLLAIFDLSNLGSACHLLTQDLGQVEGDFFRLLGRAQGAALRGCSLTAEELAGARG